MARYDYKDTHSAWNRALHPDRPKRYANQSPEGRSARSNPSAVARKPAVLKAQDQKDAELAAKRAMTDSSQSADSTHLQYEEVPCLPTARRYKAVGYGLSNKTLRDVTPSQIPRPSSRHSMRPDTHYLKDAAVLDLESATESYGALPSSYRKLRKAKSMFSPRSHGMVSHQSQWRSSRATERSLRSVTSSAMLPSNNLRVRIKRSLTFLRPKSTLAAQTKVDYDWGGREEAVQMARAQFLDGMEQQRLQNRATSPAKFALKLQHKSTDDHLKTSHGQDLAQSRSGASDVLESPETRSAKRSFSTSLRHRFRKVLGRSFTSKDKIPPQQLDARKSHLWDLGDEGDAANAFDTYLVENEAQMVQHNVYHPEPSDHQDALEDLDKFSQTLQPAASRESLHSNSRSRVTSWTNSTNTGSISLRSGPIERNRLSIIKEDGAPYQPSSSAGRHIGGVDVFREPLQSTWNDGRVLPPIDSQRVYSALIKRINQEEAEAERTRAALEAINQSNANTVEEVVNIQPTIRAVHSDSSLASRVTVAPDEQHREFSVGSCVRHPGNKSESHQQHDGSVLKQQDQLAMQESQSSFFPFSSEKNPGAPSPFKRFLEERGHRGRSNTYIDSNIGNDSVVVRRIPSDSIVNRPRYGMSSESIYSQTTNGGFNEQYRNPIGSSEDLGWAQQTASETTGMATIISGRYSQSRSDSDPPSTVRRQASSSEWNPWSDTLTAIRVGDADKSSNRMQEQAPVNLDIGSHNAQAENQEDLVVLRNASDISSQLPLVDVKTVPSGNPSKPARTINVRKSRRVLFDSGSADALDCIPDEAEDHCKGKSGLRKMSPSNIGKILRVKKSQMLNKQDHRGKENIPTDHDGSSPITTPGSSQLQFRSGNTAGWLRKKASERAFGSQNGSTSTPRSAPPSNATTPSRFGDSPSQKAKDCLVSRLSRPFNMDVPLENRPFDSMFLGKRTQGFPDTIGNSRLSVAQQVPNLSKDTLTQDGYKPNVAEPTIPRATSPAVGRSASRVLGMLTSKRMVSNFLRSRRGERSTSQQSLTGGSPAFL
ncbi:hypothetical protein EDD36DRAFT_413305 [Exophiala viscosa]|uniref:Uncharacterized protein n=1 Tax=Exophiala viscosa TaxID=2486360 RepID=A0AAN6IHF4_9EURO|nr:hypothetical protein EDD36DRAFT_413305 [Exophiala viscosa]